MRSKIVTTIIALTIALISACGGEKNNERSKFAPPPKEKPLTYEEAVADWVNQKGIGPVTKVDLGELDMELAKKGEEIYVLKCTACHMPNEEKLGPAPIGIMDRRTPEWIMNMILNPEEMVQKDPIAKDLLIEFNGSPMANQNLTQDQARAVLEYFRTL